METIVYYCTVDERDPAGIYNVLVLGLVTVGYLRPARLTRSTPGRVDRHTDTEYRGRTDIRRGGRAWVSQRNKGA